MIAHLSGNLLSKQATSAIVDVGGVGYEVAIPLSTFYELGEAGEAVQLRIYTHVREDAIQHYGFKTIRERELFLQLISVNGVGPGLAIKLLSGMNADEMIASIRTNNLVRLVAIPGVGKDRGEISSRFARQGRSVVFGGFGTGIRRKIRRHRSCDIRGFNA